MSRVVLYKGGVDSRQASMPPPYLVGTLPESIDELLDDQVDAYQTRPFQLNDLLFHYGLKRQVGGEQACPAGQMDTRMTGHTDRDTRTTDVDTHTKTQTNVANHSRR